MKKYISLLTIFLFYGCSLESNFDKNDEKFYEEIIFFTNPIHDSDYPLEVTENLSEYMIRSLSEVGYFVGEFNVVVASSQIMVGEALASGSAHIGVLSAANYISFKDLGITPALITKKTATTLSNPNTTLKNPDLKPGYIEDEFVSFDQAYLLLANNDKTHHLRNLDFNTVSFEEISNLTWCVQPPTHLSGYIYPNKWLFDTFGKTFNDLNYVLNVNNTYEFFVGFYQEQCDIGGIIAESWLRFEKTWATDFKTPESIFHYTSAVADIGKVPYSVITFSDKSTLSQDIKDEIIRLFIEYIDTEEGKEFYGLFGITALGEFNNSDIQVFDFAARATFFMRDVK